MNWITRLILRIVVAGLIAYLLWWLIAYIGLPQPFAKIAQCLVAVLAVIFLINELYPLGRGGPTDPPAKV